MPQPISPWSNSARLVSPDGRYLASMDDANEVGMGAPTIGTLILSENRESGKVLSRHESCNPSFVWASDSTAIAAPQWTANQQRLIVISVPAGRVNVLAGQFRVLQLHSLHEGIVKGVDSPVYMPTLVELSICDVVDK